MPGYKAAVASMCHKKTGHGVLKKLIHERIVMQKTTFKMGQPEGTANFRNLAFLKLVFLIIRLPFVRRLHCITSALLSAIGCWRSFLSFHCQSRYTQNGMAKPNII